MCSSSGGQIVLYSLWYNHTETIEWSKIIKIIEIIKTKFCKPEHMVVKFTCEFFFEVWLLCNNHTQKIHT